MPSATSNFCDVCTGGLVLPDNNTASGCCAASVTNCVDCGSDSTKCKTCATGYTATAGVCGVTPAPSPIVTHGSITVFVATLCLLILAFW